MMLSKVHTPRPFVASSAATTRRSVVTTAARRAETRSVARAQKARLQTRSAEPEDAEVADFAEDEDRGSRRRGRGEDDKPEFKHFLPLPKPAHLIYIKPTVAVVAGMATRSSVGLKMTAGANQLERYVIEYYARSVK